jgi:hypothetical protein
LDKQTERKIEILALALLVIIDSFVHFRTIPSLEY